MIKTNELESEYFARLRRKFEKTLRPFVRIEKMPLNGLFLVTEPGLQDRLFKTHEEAYIYAKR